MFPAAFPKPEMKTTRQKQLWYCSYKSFTKHNREQTPSPPKLQIHQKTLWAEKKQELVLKSVKKGSPLPRLNPDEMNSDKPTPETFLCFSVHLHAQSLTSPRHSQTPIYTHTNTFLKAVRGIGPLHEKTKTKPLRVPSPPRIDTTWS